MSKRIFVFGSNLAGIHGAGSAKEAYEKHGAAWGCGFGLSGNSFAIPTKDENLRTLDLKYIDRYVEAFLQFSRAGYHMGWEFDVVDIGCGLAGYTPKKIASLFYYASIEPGPNVNFLGELKNLVGKDATPS